MLRLATLSMSLFAMGTTLWMGFYLFARGFPNRMTVRVVVVMLALAGFFYGAYYNIFEQVEGSAAVRAVLLVIVLAAWYSVTFHIMTERNQARYRLLKWGMFGLAGLSIVVLLQPQAFILEQGNDLYVAHMNPNGWAYRIYGGYQFLVSFGIMLNLLIGDRVGLTSRGKYFLVTSVFPVISVIYGVISLGSPNPAPRIVQDSLAFCGVFVLGLSVARHQTLSERRATLQDFPLTTISTLGLAAMAVFFAWRNGMPLQSLAAVVGFVILAVGSYDLTRELLERQRRRGESQFRRQMRQLEGEGTGDEALRTRLQEGLELLCREIEAPGGFVAVRQGETFRVMASRSSVAAGSVLSAQEAACEDVCRPQAASLSSTAWLAPSFEGLTQMAVVGIEQSKSRLEYSSASLELLAEAADQIGTIVSLNNVRPLEEQRLREIMNEAQAHTNELNAVAGELLESLSANPDSDFIRMVEDSLRHLPDTIALGQSALAERMGIKAETHVGRGKQLQALLMESIELLKPAEKRPSEPLPRIWYNHAVLHDAYVEGVPNREIMARLYISEGTFNRTRRNAIRGLARLLAERQHST